MTFFSVTHPILSSLIFPELSYPQPVFTTICISRWEHLCPPAYYIYGYLLSTFSDLWAVFDSVQLRCQKPILGSTPQISPGVLLPQAEKSESAKWVLHGRGRLLRGRNLYLKQAGLHFVLYFAGLCSSCALNSHFPEARMDWMKSC